MIHQAILGTSIVLQFIAAFLALNLIRVTGWRVAWSMIAGAMVLMGARSSIILYHSVFDSGSAPPNLSAELVALTISALMVAGAAKVAPVFEANRRNEEALRSSDQRLRLATEAAGVGIWSRSLPDDRIVWDGRVEAICGIEPGSFEGTMDAFLARVHPDDREYVAASHKRTLDEAIPYDIDYRIIHPDGGVRHINSRAAAIEGHESGGARMMGVVLDVTERKQAGEALRESLVMLSKAQSRAKLGFWDWSFDGGGVEHWSDNSAEILGFPIDNFYGGHEIYLEMVHPDDREFVREAYRLHYPDNDDDSSGYDLDYRILRPDGSVIWINEIADQERDGRGKVIRNVGTIQDITERKQAETALKESEQRFKDLAEIGTDRFWESDTEFRFTRVIDSSGIGAVPSPHDVLGQIIWDVAGIDPGRDEDWDAYRADIAALLPFRNFRRSFTGPDGRKTHWSVSGRPIFDEHGDFKGYCGTSKNETKEVEALRRAETAEDRLIDAIESFPESFALFDSDDRLVHFNAAFEKLMFYSICTPAKGVTYREILQSKRAAGDYLDLGQEAPQWLADRLKNHKQAVGATEQLYPDGSWSWINERRTREGGTVLVTIDITERKKMEAALRSSEHRLHAIIDQHRDAILVVRSDGIICFSNPAAEHILGLKTEDLIGAPFGIPIVGEDIAEIVIPGREIIHAEMQVVPVEWDGADAGLVSLRDITRSKHAEENARQLRTQLAHAARMSTLGNMAEGLAHEINQPLSAISIYTQACLQSLHSSAAPDRVIIENLEKVGQQVSHAANVIRWLRDSVKKEPPRKVRLDLNSCVREVAEFLSWETRAAKSILVFELSDGLPPVIADRVQIQQVILNLLQNSNETVIDGGPRRITIRTLSLADGTVRVEVSDDGPGILDEIAGDLFTPFFTTKSDGLGFGLSISNSIVEAHGGRIWVDPEAKQGATFFFTLPTVRKEAA